MVNQYAAMTNAGCHSLLPAKAMTDLQSGLGSLLGAHQFATQI